LGISTMMFESISSKIIPYIVASVSSSVVLLGDSSRNAALRRLMKAAGYTALLVFSIYNIVVGTLGIDRISALFSMLAALIGLASSLYTEDYEVYKYRIRRLRTLIDVFALSVYAVFASPHLFVFIVLWLFAEIVGFLAIVFEIEQRTLVAGLRYLLVSMVPSDIALLTLLAIASLRMGFAEAVVAPVDQLSNVIQNLDPVISLIILVGLGGKAALAPLHFWLPDAHSLAPAPASAILSGIMVKMGVYAILRVIPVADVGIAVPALAVLASISIVYGGLQALIQSDIKRILAYSTIENVGLAILALSLWRMYGVPSFFTAFILLVAAHALFKSSLFIDSGTIEVVLHTRELRRLGYFSKVAPQASMYALMSVLSMIGAPPTIGFLSKLYLFISIAQLLSLDTAAGILFLAVAATGVALTIAYSFRYMLAHWGSLAARAGPEAVPKGAIYLFLGEALLSVSGIILAIPIFYVACMLGLTTFEIVIVIAVAAITLLAIPVIVWLYNHIKSTVYELHWLGGYTP